ncbi:hypothetical protein F4776DRAFT_660859 [Hypoxylon sp. NC0597]|nr:hypothetical protein F4776DRAFT_660859 [Hypoxylon sp. NC0597]
MSTFFEFRLFKLKERFQIDNVTWTMLEVHEDLMIGLASPNLLAEAVDSNRLSLLQGANRLEDIAKASAGLGDDTAKHCSAIVAVINDILRIANLSREPPRFATLPPEIRNHIYSYYFNTSSGRALIPLRPRSYGCMGCQCYNPCYRISLFGPQNLVDISLALTSRAVKREALSYLYHYRTMYFPCTCSVAYHLGRNPILKANLAHIELHWTAVATPICAGELRAISFTSLKVNLPTGGALFVTVHRQQMQCYYIWRRGSNDKALSTARCILDLMGLPGVRAIHLEHIAPEREVPPYEITPNGLFRLLWEDDSGLQV